MIENIQDTLSHKVFSEIGAEWMQAVRRWLADIGMNDAWADRLDNVVMLLLILCIALMGNLLCRHVVLETVAKIVKRTKATWDDIVFDRKVMIHLSRIVAQVILYLMVPVAFPEAAEPTLSFFRRLCQIYILIVALRFVNAFLVAVYHVYSEMEAFRNRPLKGLLQTAQVSIVFVGGIIVIGWLIDKNPLMLLTGLGASAAILMLVFKDSIMGFVSGIQLSANNMLKVGDWIEMPKYGANGTVTEVTLNTVKVRNWDNTVTTIPPYLLVSDSFQNWQGMRESGGRRVKRSVSIDMDSVRFCTQEMLERYKKIQLISDYIRQTEEEVAAYNSEHDVDDSVPVNGRRQTNLGVFRAYLVRYLQQLPTVNHGLRCMVRQLQPTEKGIPVELYFFANETEWGRYEEIQADVFDHVLAIVPEFDLQVYQSPSGSDLRKLSDISR